MDITVPKTMLANSSKALKLRKLAYWQRCASAVIMSTLNAHNSLKTHNMGTKHSSEEPAHQDLSIDTKCARK